METNNTTRMEGNTRYVSYLRVSTKEQGQSGLGLSAQRTLIANTFCAQRIAIEFTEVQSGANDSRPQLKAAIAYCKDHGLTLVVAKLDRLSRSARMVLDLQESGIPFLVADNPAANELTIGILAVIARNELKTIQARTKQALKEKDAKGEEVGFALHKNKEASLQKLATARTKGLEVRKENALARTFQAKLMAESLSKNGLSTRKIADELNRMDIKTSKGKQFSSMQVSRLLSKS